MSLHFAQPHSHLQPYVQAYILYKQLTPAPSQSMTPLGSAFIFALLQGKVSFIHPQKPAYHLPALSLLGQHTYALAGHQIFPNQVAAIKFSPFGCYALFGVDMSTLQDSYLDLSTTQLKGMRLIDSLKQATGMEQIKLIFDEWLLQQPIREKQVKQVAKIVEIIEENRGNVTVEQVLQRFFLSERTLQRLFSKVVGLTPKLFIRIRRFNHVLAGLEEANSTLKDIIFRAGYFDQSHFIKDFLQFTQCNPSAFRHEDRNQISLETIRGLLKQLS